MSTTQTSPTPISSIHKGRTNCWRIPVEKTVCEPGFNARGIDYDQDPEAVALLDPGIVTLAHQIAEHGVRMPGIGAMRDGMFRLTDGHRRRCGLRLALARGLLSPDDPRALYPVLPEPQHHGTDDRILDMLVLNSGKPLELIEQATAMVRLLDEFPEQWNEQKIAKATGFSITHIRNCVLLKRHACPELLDSILRGEIATTTAVELVRSIGHDHDAQRAALDQVSMKTRSKPTSRF